MRLADFSLRRPVTVVMTTLAVVLFGLVAVERLQLQLLPHLSYPTLTVETELPGASPVEVEQLVTRSVEEAVGVVSGVERMKSVSRPGSSVVTIGFGWGRDMGFAAIDVREKLDSLQLPQEAGRPLLRRFDPSSEPLMRLYLTGEADLFMLRELAEEVVERELEISAGVAAVQVSGGLVGEIEVVVDEGRLAAMGLTMASVSEALSKANVDQAGGSLYEQGARRLVRIRNRIVDVEELHGIPIVATGGAKVLLGDVATVKSVHQERESITRFGLDESVQIALYREGDANSVEVSEAVRRRLMVIDDKLPPGVELHVAVDQSEYISASIDEVSSSALIGGGLAMVVLLMFLRSLGSALVVSVAIPVSVVATFLLMHQSGMSLNVMSLGGLALGIGMLVDSSIVVLEAIVKRHDDGASSTEAAREGAARVGTAVVASTLTSVVVFVPVVFLDGIAAQLFSDMALTVCFSLVASLVVSLTLVPVTAVALLKTSRRGRASVGIVRRGRQLVSLLTAVFDAGYGVVREAYPRVLTWALRHPLAVVGLAALMLGAAVMSVSRLGVELLPSMRQGRVELQVELAPGTPLEQTDALLRAAVADFVDDPRVQSVASLSGKAAAGMDASKGGAQERARVVFELRAGVTPEDEDALAAEFAARLSSPQVLQLELQSSVEVGLTSALEVVVHGHELESIHAAAAMIVAELKGVDGVRATRTSASVGSPEIEVIFDRELLATRGLHVADVAALVRHKLHGEVDTRLRQDARELEVRSRVIRAKGGSLDELGALVVSSREGSSIRLEDVADIEQVKGPVEIQRREQARVAVVTVEQGERDVASVVSRVEGVLSGLDLPIGTKAEVVGLDDEIERSIESLALALVLASCLVYVVMASQFESFVQPFVILLTLPLGAVGVVVGILASGGTVSVISVIGMVMLVGIVVNNAIVLVDAINQRRRAGRRVREAIHEAGRERLRPILMTSTSTVLGLLPMVLGEGEGVELRSALAVAVIGGLVTGTVLTLVVIPSVYWLVSGREV